MACLKFPKISAKTTESGTTVLNMTVEALEAGKGVICDAASVPGLGVALEVAIGILKKVQAAKLNSEALKTLCTEVKSLLDLLERLVETIEAGLEKYPVGSPHRALAQEAVSGSSSKLHRRVERLVENLRVIRNEADLLSKRSRFSRFLHSTKDAETITNMKDKISTAREHFQIEGSVNTEALVIDALRGVETIIKTEEERILREIRVDTADYRAEANKAKARFQEGTREAMFQRLEEWVQECVAGRASQPVCVLVGEAGTGKSTIASQFASRLGKDPYYGGTFFFTRGVQELNSPKKVFATLASQLAESQPALRIPVINAAREHLRIATVQRLEVEFETFLLKPLNALYESEPNHHPIFVLLDALDECTDDGPTLVPQLLTLLLSLAVRPGSPLRIFLTSRPEPHYIHKVLDNPDMKPHISTISIQDFRASVERDIRSLVTDSFALDKTSQRWAEANPSIVDNLVMKSDGLFIYARTAVDFILADVDDDGSMQERYEALLSIDRPLELPPLDVLYHAVLQGVFPSGTRLPEMQTRLQSVLAYLATLQEPDGVSPSTLQKLTLLPTTQSIPIINKLRSVVFFERDKDDSPFRIIHATFREFLVNPSRTAQTFYVDEEQAQRAHASLADNCMSVMRSFVADHFRCSPVAAFLKAITMNSIPELSCFPYLYYAHRYLDYHRRNRTAQKHRLDDEDDIPAISSVVALIIYSPPPTDVWALMHPVLAHLLQSLPTMLRNQGFSLLALINAAPYSSAKLRKGCNPYARG